MRGDEQGRGGKKNQVDDCHLLLHVVSLHFFPISSLSRVTWLCVPHARQKMSPSSWLKAVPRQTEHWLAIILSGFYLIEKRIRRRAWPHIVVRR